MSKSSVLKAWSDKIGRKVEFEIKEVEAADGRKQTQLINPEGTIVMAVNLTGADAEKALTEHAGEPFLHDAFTWAEIQGPNQGNQVNKADLSVPTPANAPGAAIEAEKGKDADKLAEDTKGK